MGIWYFVVTSAFLVYCEEKFECVQTQTTIKTFNE